MVVLSKEYLNTTCQIHAPNNMMIGVGKVTTIGENYIVLSNTSEGFPTLRFLSFVKITMKHPHAGYKVILASVSESENFQIRLGNLNLLTDDEKRGYFRIHIKMPTRIFLSGSSTDVEQELNAPDSDSQSEPIPFFDVMVKDMSLGGTLIESDAFLQIGQKIVVEIVTPRLAQLFLVTIRRRYRDELEENAPYQYGCVLTEKNNKKLDELCRFILETQSQIIHKVKNGGKSLSK